MKNETFAEKMDRIAEPYAELMRAADPQSWGCGCFGCLWVVLVGGFVAVVGLMRLVGLGGG
jgi:hypothetical protein